MTEGRNSPTDLRGNAGAAPGAEDDVRGDAHPNGTHPDNAHANVTLLHNVLRLLRHLKNKRPTSPGN